jgi:hypothetical protein
VIGSRRRLGLALVAAAALVFAPASTPTAGAARIAFEKLAVDGPAWRATNLFNITWQAVGTGGAIYTVDYLIRDPSSTPISPLGRYATAGGQLPSVRIPVPPGSATVPPGRYTIELWAEDGGGPHVFATLGYDDQSPAAARPVVPGGWLKAGSYADVEIEHPGGPLPISGIRGYAVLLDHTPTGIPCAGPDQCTEAETNLHAGVGDDLIRVGPLLEQTNVVRVVAVSNAGARSPQLESAAIHVDGTPPQLAFRGLPPGWSNQPVRISAVATDLLSGMAAGGPEGPFTGLSVDRGVPTLTQGEQASATVHGDGDHLLLATARDAVGNEIEPGASAPRAQVLIDESPPHVSFAVARDPAEPERIVAAVADPLSGPASRGTIAVRPAGSSQRFEQLPTTFRAGLLSAVWNSDSYPRGDYEFRVTGYDLAGNEVSSERRADGAPMVLASPLKAATALSFGFGGRHLVWHRCARRDGDIRCHRKVIVAFDRRPARRTVPFGHGIPVGGRLTDGAGVPLAGVEVEVGERFASGSSPRSRTTTVVTGADGAFLARLEPGPSRQVSAGFAGTRQLSRAAGRDLRLGVRARVRLRASTSVAAIGGAPIEFRGRVDHQDAPIPPSGLAVELQFQVLGSPWSEFRTVQTDAFGRFSYPYAFSDDDSRGIRFQFRALVPEQVGWPYEAGASLPVGVTGR